MPTPLDLLAERTCWRCQERAGLYLNGAGVLCNVCAWNALPADLMAQPPPQPKDSDADAL